MKPKVESDV